VLLDYRSWATKEGVGYDSFSTRRISLGELLQCAKEQGTEFRPGDILLIRSGWTEDYNKRSYQEKMALGGKESRTFVGVDNSVEMAKWHWDMGFAAVAGDTNAYEAWPPDRSSPLKHALHEVFLSGWGLPIGELWNLEKLAEECQRTKKWSFFLISQPLDVPGGVASPCNAMAVL
jgi:kynurenine formamidase